VGAQVRSVIWYSGQDLSWMIFTFGDELLTNTVSILCPRCFATTPRRHLLGTGGPQGPGTTAVDLTHAAASAAPAASF